MGGDAGAKAGLKFGLKVNIEHLHFFSAPMSLTQSGLSTFLTRWRYFTRYLFGVQ